MIIGLLQIVAPLFWFGFMGAVGVSAGNLASSLSMANSTLIENPSASAAQAGTDTIKTTAKSAIHKDKNEAGAKMNIYL